MNEAEVELMHAMLSLKSALLPSPVIQDPDDPNYEDDWEETPAELDLDAINACIAGVEWGLYRAGSRLPPFAVAIANLALGWIREVCGRQAVDPMRMYRVYSLAQLADHSFSHVLNHLLFIARYGAGSGPSAPEKPTWDGFKLRFNGKEVVISGAYQTGIMEQLEASGWTHFEENIDKEGNDNRAQLNRKLDAAGIKIKIRRRNGTVFWEREL